MKKDKDIRPAAGGLRVDVVDTYDGFMALRPVWERLQERDLECTFYLTWKWMAEVLRDNAFRWFVIVVRAPGNGDEAICILPLKCRVHWSHSREELQTHLEAGGRLLWSEYTGFLCDPAFEEQGLMAAAQHLSGLPWTRLAMRYVAQTRRARFFTDQMKELGFSVRYRDYQINKGETDNLVCPQIDLPEDFDAYLQNQVSANTRQRCNKTKRRYLETGDYHFVHATDETLQDDLTALLMFWKKRWVRQKGGPTAEVVASNYRETLTAAHRCGALFLPMLCKGDRRLGALGHVVDRRNGIMHFIVAGRDVDAEEAFIGEALHFHSIAWAISQGFICYDFAHGNEKYKYSYGAENLETLYFDVQRRSSDDTGVFDIMCLGEAMRRIEDQLKKGKPDRALKACSQLAELLS